MRKICVLTANRADFSRLETVCDAIKEHKDLELQLVVMGSHLLDVTGKTIDEIKRKGFDVTDTVYMEISGGNPLTMTKSVGLAIIELTNVLERLKPDVVIAPVDRFESLAMGITPALMNIHVAHTQGGEVTGTIDESIRHALTKMSHIHFVSTDESKKRVVRMGEPEDYVFNVGCPGTDIIEKTPVLSKEETVAEVNKLIKMEDRLLNPDEPYFLLMQHPVTTEYMSAAEQMSATLDALEKFNTRVLALWPNIDAGSNEISTVLRRYSDLTEQGKRLTILKHIPSELFINVMRHAACQVGNSSSGIREACYIGTPVVNVGSRQNARERGKNVKDVDYDTSAIIEAIEAHLAVGNYKRETLYGDGTAGTQIAEILATIELPDIQKKITH